MPGSKAVAFSGRPDIAGSIDVAGEASDTVPHGSQELTFQLGSVGFSGVRKGTAMTPKVSSKTYEAIWDGLLDVARARYYYAEVERWLQYPVWSIRFLLAASGTGAFVSIIGSWTWLTAVFGAAVPILVIVDLLLDGTKRLAQVQAVNAGLTKLHEDYRALWEDVRNNAMEDHQALEEKKRLLATMTRTTEIADVWVIDRINRTASEHAYKVEAARYVT